MSTYTRPTLSDLGQVEDLTQISIAIKLSKPGTDVHISKDGISKVKNAPQKGVTIYG